MPDTVLVRPLRGHQSRHLRRWVQAGEDPYACPDDEADRLVRHGCVEIVGGVDPAEEGGAVTATLGEVAGNHDDSRVATLPGDDDVEHWADSDSPDPLPEYDEEEDES